MTYLCRCKRCKLQVASHAKVCPRCGAKMTYNYPAIIFSVLAVVLFIVALFFMNKEKVL